MKIYIKETGEIKSVTLKVWEYGQWSNDYFWELDPNFPLDNPERLPDDDAIIMCSQSEFDSLIKYWKNEANTYNGDDESIGDPEEYDPEKDYLLLIDY